MVNGRTVAEDMERECHLASLSLRDTFAAAALTGLLTRREYDACEFATACEYAYRYADAMLRERDSRAGQKIAERDSFCAVCPERDKTSAQTDNDRGFVTPESYAKSDEKRGVSDTDRATLTDEEREAVELCVKLVGNINTASSLFGCESQEDRKIEQTLRKLLERLGGER